MKRPVRDWHRLAVEILAFLGAAHVANWLRPNHPFDAIVITSIILWLVWPAIREIDPAGDEAPTAPATPDVPDDACNTSGQPIYREIGRCGFCGESDVPVRRVMPRPLPPPPMKDPPPGTPKKERNTLNLDNLF